MCRFWMGPRAKQTRCRIRNATQEPIYLLPTPVIESSEPRPYLPAALSLRCQDGSDAPTSPKRKCHSDMSSRRTVAPFSMCVLSLLAPCLPAQERATVELSLRDGTTVKGDAPTLRSARLEVRTSAGQKAVALGDVLAVHGTAVARSNVPAFHLQGGEVVRGLPSSGDPNGEWVAVTSPGLGQVRLPVDRLDCVLFRPELAAPRDLLLPQGTREALFTKAATGFDIVTGALHEFSADGIRFQPARESAARWFRFADLVGYRLADPAQAATRGEQELLTRAGDRVRVTMLGWEKGELRFRREDGTETKLKDQDLACLTMSQADVVFLASVQPKAAEESSWDGPALYPYQRNLSAVGTPLIAAGRSWGSGLGVHSRSKLAYEVPPGAQVFQARVGVDDSALTLVPRANVDVRVLVNGKVVFEARGLGPGTEPRNTGLLPVQPGCLVELEVDFGSGRDLADRVDWLMPVFLPGPGRN